MITFKDTEKFLTIAYRKYKLDYDEQVMVDSFVKYILIDYNFIKWWKFYQGSFWETHLSLSEPYEKIWNIADEIVLITKEFINEKKELE
jgi:hypothetical protein